MIHYSFYDAVELLQLGFKSLGENVQVSRKASFYNPDLTEIGNNVRIDDFCILSGRVKLGSYIHISAYSALYGKFGIELRDFSGISPRTTIFSAVDDFSGDYLIGPVLPEAYRKVTGGKVIIESFVQIGAGCVIMPGLKIGEGAIIGSLSFVNKSVDGWGIYAGIPIKFIKSRKKGLLSQYEKFIKDKKTLRC